MAKSIAEYTAEISKNYDNSRNALQKQIDAIEGNLATTQEQINRNYAQQQNQLNNQRNMAASSASMQAGGSGGSFGGMANIANKKYYEQSFVPAQTQLNTNQTTALENAQTQANNNRQSLEYQLAQMNDEIARLGLQRYYQVLEQEREDAYRKQQLASSNDYMKYLTNAANNAAKYVNVGSGSDYQFRNNDTGASVRFGTFMTQFGGDYNSRARDYLQQMANNGDANARLVLNQIGNRKIANGYQSGTYNNNSAINTAVNNALRTLGIRLV